MKHLLVLMMCLPLVAGAGNRKEQKADAETEAWRYEIEYVSNSNSNDAIVKVWSYSKKPQVAAEQSKKNAVHAVIFKGIPAKDRYIGRKPLVSGAKDDAFFNGFFAEGGDYMRFVALTNSGALGGGDVLKTSKKEYKVGVTVTVMVDDLRKYLEEKGVVRKLGSGF